MPVDDPLWTHQSASEGGFISMGVCCEDAKVKVYEESYDKIQRNPELKDIIFRKLAKARV